MLVVAYATGRASYARQAKGDDPDEKGYPGLPGWGLGMRLTTSPCKKKYCYETSSGGQGPHRVVEPMMRRMRVVSFTLRPPYSQIKTSAHIWWAQKLVWTRWE